MPQLHRSQTHGAICRLDFVLLDDGTLLFSPFDSLEDDKKGEDGQGFESGTPVHHFTIHSGELSSVINLLKAAHGLTPDNDLTIEQFLQAIFTAGEIYCQRNMLKAEVERPV